jgi:hypothetical protein
MQTTSPRILAIHQERRRRLRRQQRQQQQQQQQGRRGGFPRGRRHLTNTNDRRNSESLIEEEQQQRRRRPRLFIIQSEEDEHRNDESNNHQQNGINQDGVQQQHHQHVKKSCTEFQIWNSSSLLWKNHSVKTSKATKTNNSMSSSSSSSSSSASTSSAPDNDSQGVVCHEQQIICTHEIPEICDKGAYLVYSPTQWQREAENLLSENTTMTTTSVTPNTNDEGTDNEGENGAAALSSSPASTVHTGSDDETDDDDDDDDGSGVQNSNGATVAYQSDPVMTHYVGGRCAFVEFYFWISCGHLYLRAPVLPFSLGIPISTSDRKYFRPELGPIANLYESFSARWGCIKYYMATAADVEEGCQLDMTVFRHGVTEHDEHRVVVLENIVSIHMQEEVDLDVPDIPKDESQKWRFFFSW